MTNNPENAARQSSIDLLYPPFAERLQRGINLARAAGLQVYSFESLRSNARQAQLYKIGRTVMGSNPTERRPMGSIVTRAQPGQSWHQYGLADDLVFDGEERPGIQWDWAGDYVGDKRDDYNRLGAIMMGVGLDWYGAVGAEFFETPHFQWPHPLSLGQVQELFAAGGLAAVWRELDKFVKPK